MQPEAAVLQFAWAALSDIGRSRSNNEDAWGAVRPAEPAVWLQPNATVLPTGGVLLMVSDGMGGALGGEEASRFCIERLGAEVAVRHATGEPAAAMRDALAATHAGVVARAATNVRWQGMGATLSALWLRPDGTGVLGHVGDSRVYGLRRGQLRQISEDHNLGASMVRRGELTAAAAARFRYNSLLEQVMGGDGRELEPQVEILDIRPGDAFALCSDGLHGPLAERNNAVLAAALEQSDLAAGCAQLVAAANAAGGPDNITVLLARMVAG